MRDTAAIPPEVTAEINHSTQMELVAAASYAVGLLGAWLEDDALPAAHRPLARKTQERLRTARDGAMQNQKWRF